MKTPSRRSPAAFTLIELMTVITLIVILASLVVGGMGFVRERQAKEKARVQIGLISKALEDYKHDNGTYPLTKDTPTPSKPETTDKLNSDIIFNALFFDSDGDGIGGYDAITGEPKDPDQKVYILELDPRYNKQGWTSGSMSATTKITDPWGNEYFYRTSAILNGDPNKPSENTQNPDFDLLSIGKDGKTNGTDPKDKTCRDDIKNF